MIKAIGSISIGRNSGMPSNVATMSQDEIAKIRAKNVFFVTDGVKYGSFDVMKHEQQIRYHHLIDKLLEKAIDAKASARDAFKQFEQLKKANQMSDANAAYNLFKERYSTSGKFARSLERFRVEGVDAYSNRVADGIFNVKSKQLVAVAKRVLELSAKRAPKV